MHTSHESRQGIIEWPTEDKPSVPRSIPKQDSALWELEKSYEALQQICSKHSSEMAQLETDAVTEIHRYQIFIVVFGVFSLCSYWGNYPEGSIGGGVGGGICLLFFALLLLRKRKNNRKKQRLLELQREDHENMRKLQEQMTKLREQ